MLSRLLYVTLQGVTFSSTAISILHDLSEKTGTYLLTGLY